jgi:hypothetical protein
MVEVAMIGVKQAGLLGLVAVGLVLVPTGVRAGDFLAAGPVVASAAAGSGAAFDAAVASGDLSQERAGDFDTTSIIVTGQSQTAEQSGNTITGDAPAGAVFVAAGALSESNGVNQFVANTAPFGAAQGMVTMNIILNPGPPAAAN